MIDTSNLIGLVNFRIEYEDGTVEETTERNLVVAHQLFATGIKPRVNPGVQDGDTRSGREEGVYEIAFGTNSVAPVRLQSLSAMAVVINKRILTYGGYAGTSVPFLVANYGGISAEILSIFKTELLAGEANGSTLRELGLVHRIWDPGTDTYLKTLFARIVRAPIVKTSAMKITVKWIICVVYPQDYIDGEQLIPTSTIPEHLYPSADIPAEV